MRDLCMGSILLAAISIFGCASISSTPITRTDGDQVYGDSNGDHKLMNGSRPFKGIPITLRVPTHLDVAIVETFYLVAENDCLVEVPLHRRHLNVKPKLVDSEKIFTVDMKRPASGSLDYTLQYGDAENSQYLKQITSDLKENTIKDVSTAISNVIPELAKLTSTEDTNQSAGENIVNKMSTKDAPVLVENRTIAWKRFDLDAPDFEEQVRLFVSSYVNECASEPH